MNKAEYSFVIGLLALILGRVTIGGLHGLWVLIGLVAILYGLFLEGMAFWSKQQSKKKPPFAMNGQFFFDTPEERLAFTDKLNGLIQETRREKDATNGLTADQLGEVGLDESGSRIAESDVDEVSAPTTVEVGQIFRSNDPRLERIVKVVEVDGDTARVQNMLNGRHATTKTASLLKTNHRGYTYEGFSK